MGSTADKNVYGSHGPAYRRLANFFASLMKDIRSFRR